MQGTLSHALHSYGFYLYINLNGLYKNIRFGWNPYKKNYIYMELIKVCTVYESFTY